MEGEIIPGTSVGPWKLNMPRSEVIELLGSLSIDYAEASPGGFDFVNTTSLNFCFDKDETLKQICVLGGLEKTSFRGISVGSRVDELGKLGYVVSMDIADRMLVIKDVAGIFFNFEGDDLDYEAVDEVLFEGDEEELRDVIRPNNILQSNIDRICITNDPEVNPMFDLNT